MEENEYIKAQGLIAEVMELNKIPVPSGMLVMTYMLAIWLAKAAEKQEDIEKFIEFFRKEIERNKKPDV